MTPNSWDLRKFTTDQLIEELARRQNEKPRIRPKQWCHDCTNFVAWNEQQRKGDMPPDFNACTKGKQMRFLAPLDYQSDFGFYMPVCSDRNSTASDETATEQTD